MSTDVAGTAPADENPAAGPDGPRPRPGEPPTLGAPASTGTAETMTTSEWFTLPRVSADGGQLGAYQVRAASLAGRAHVADGRTRQDDYGCALSTSGVAILAVADGLGAPRHRYSSAGAHEVASQACAIIRDYLDESRRVDPREVAAIASDYLFNEYSASVDCQPDELATTLAACWLTPTGEFSAFAVGDSGLAALTGDSWAQLLGDGAALLNDVTSSLPREDPHVVTAQGSVPRDGALLLATDGLLRPLGAPQVGAFLADRWRQPPGLLDFVHDLAFRRRGETDDRTAVCAWFRPGAEV